MNRDRTADRPQGTLTGPSRTIIVEPLEAPREEPEPEPVEPEPVEKPDREREKEPEREREKTPA